MLKIWLKFLKYSLVDMTAYKADVLLRLVGMVWMVVVMIFVLSLPFKYVDGLAGWDWTGVMIVLGFYYMSNGLSWMLFKESISRLEIRVRRGTLDNILMKPVSSMFIASFFNVDVSRVMDSLVGLGLLVFIVLRQGVTFGIAEVIGAILAFLAGLMISYSIYLIVNTLCFWTTETYLDHVTNPVFLLAKYPVDIWGERMAKILYWVVPLAFISTVPAAILLGKVEPWVGGVGLLLGLVWVGVASLFWRFAIRSYSSVGG